MFKAPFSFDGRIRRTEYGISFIIYIVVVVILQVMMGAAVLGSADAYSSSSGSGMVLLFIVCFIPLVWFMWAQGAKRCHDLGNSGWWQLIPFYGLWMLFADGQAGPNSYGDNPKNIQQTSGGQVNVSNPKQAITSTTYEQGGYSGGHNNHGMDNSSSNNYIPPSSTGQNKSAGHGGEYKGGDLYR